ncbi:MAG: nucleotidyltransferase family protein [Rhodospirillales bacterium]|nr:nucleotidyltransferase family protein [Rhodospirillales bacterium]
MLKWRQTLIGPEDTILQALGAINAARSQLALVVDGEHRLLGTLSDGDIRRALLTGATVEDRVAPWMNRDARVAYETDRPEDVLAMMRVHGLHKLPVLDVERRVVGLRDVDDFLRQRRRDNPVVIMAGGLGSRLDALTRDRPKPMLPVGGRPLLETIIARFVEQGFCDIRLAVNYHADIIVRHFGDGSRFGAEIRYLREKKRLGTAGALSLMPPFLSRPVIVSNADLLTSMNYGSLLETHLAAGAEATMAVREQEHAIPFGVVHQQEGRVERIEEKPSQSVLVNAGVYVLDPEVLSLVPPDTFYDMPQLIEDLIGQGRVVQCHRVDGYWLDIGRPADYERAQSDFAGSEG